MKIYQIVPTYPPQIGGMEKKSKELATRLAALGHSVTIITSKCKNGDSENNNEPNLTVKRLHSITLANTPIIPGLFIELLRIKKSDIVHLHISQAYTPELLLIASKIVGFKYIAHVHLDINSSGFFGFLLPVYKKVLLSKVLKNAHRVLVMTEDYKILIEKKYNIDAAKIVIIPNPSSIDPIKKKSSYELHEPIRLLYVGRLVVQKNIPLLIEAVKSVSKMDRKHKYVFNIVGEGPLMAELRQLVRNENLTEVVNLLGGKYNKDLVNTYIESDMLLLASREESFGNIIIEAMSCGIPVLSTNISAVKNLIFNLHNGILCDANADELAENIIKLVENKELRARITKNALEYSHLFSWNDLLTEYISLYHTI